MPSKNIRLNAVGHFDESQPGVDVSDVVFDRPVMLVYTGKFDSMDGEVTITEQHIDLLMKNRNSLVEKLKRLANGDIPMRECPPLQLDHSPSATMTIGRLVGPLTKGTIDIEGQPQLALFGTARFLGRDNVEKAKDGRYTHVSIGADLEDGILNELSVTPFPAAPHASLLAKGNQLSKEGEEDMHEKLKKHLMEHRKLSAEEAEKLSKECLAHHQKHLGLDDEKMGKHLAEAKDEDLKRMTEEHDEAKKKLSEKPAGVGSDGDAPEADKKLAAAKGEFVRLALGIRKSAKDFGTELRQATVASKLSSLRTAGKITPAEIKKLDVVKMASLSDEAVASALATFDTRQPVLIFGQVSGSTKAAEVAKITKDYNLAKLEMQTRLNMPLKAKEAKTQLTKIEADYKTRMAEVGNPNEVDNKPPEKGMLTKLTYEEMCAMLDDKSKHEELKRHLSHMMDHHGLEMPEHSEEKMSALAKKQAELQTNLDAMIALASPALGIKPDEITS